LKNLILLFCILINTISFAQTTKGTVTADGMPLQMANIVLKNTKNQPSVPQTVLIILMVFQWEL
jgi:outer membrane receptor for ferrienterochelin and colicins